MLIQLQNRFIDQSQLTRRSAIARVFMEACLNYHCIGLHHEWDAITRPNRRRATRRRDAMSIGLSILINFGPVAPIADQQPEKEPERTIIKLPGVEVYHPPSADRPGLNRSAAAREAMQQLIHVRLPAEQLEAVDSALLSLAKLPKSEADKHIERIASDNSFQINFHGNCLGAVAQPGDVFMPGQPGKLERGDLCAAMFRGLPNSMGKVFCGTATSGGRRRVKFYLAEPEGFIDIALEDLMCLERFEPVRELDGHALLAQASAHAHRQIELFGTDGLPLETFGTRRGGWVASMKALVDCLRALPE